MSERSRFITVLAYSSIILQLYFAYEAVSNLAFMNSMYQRPELQIADQMLPSMAVSTTGTAIELVVYLFGIIASAAMLFRYNWGRLMYMVILTIITLWGIGISMESYLSVSELLRSLGLGESLTLLLLGSILSLGVNGVLLWKLSREEIRKEFMQE